ncbi:MAG: hypothetical protein ABI679_08280 [Gemmatimonadota bacterium]
MKPLLAVAATGIAAVLLWKLMAVVLLPMVGLAIGLAALVLKVVFVFFLLVFAYWLYRKTAGHEDSMAG